MRGVHLQARLTSRFDNETAAIGIAGQRFADQPRWPAFANPAAVYSGGTLKREAPRSTIRTCLAAGVRLPTHAASIRNLACRGQALKHGTESFYMP